MAENIVSPTDAPDSPHFEPFKWHRDETEHANLPGGAVMSFATKARDISLGVQTILEIIERDSLAEDFGDKKLFSENHQSGLLRMAIASLSMLGIRSGEIIDWAYEHHTDAGRSEGKAA